MKAINAPQRILRPLTKLAVILTLLAPAKFAAQAATINFTTPANCTADTDVVGSGGLAYAYNFATSQTLNGVPFIAQTSPSSLGGGNITLTGFTTRNAALFTSSAAPFTNLSAAYRNTVVGAVYSTNSAATTVTLNNLGWGRQYVVQLWAGDPRAAFPTRTEALYSPGGVTNILDYNSSNADGGVGQYTIGTFVADNSSQDFYLDSTLVSGSIPQLNAIQVRDVTGVWSGTTSSTWSDTDSTSANFTGMSFQGVKAVGTTNVYFQDKDAGGVNAPATTTVTIGAGGVSGVSATFVNNLLAYTVNSADATGIAGDLGITLSGTNQVTVNGANTYTGSTVLGSKAQLVIGASGSIAGSTNITLGTGSTLTLGNSAALAGAALINMGANSVLDASSSSLPLASGQTLKGATGALVKGNVTANAGSAIALGNVGGPGTLTFNNNLTLNGQALAFDVGYGPASSGDKLIVNGGLTLNGNTVLSLNYLGGALYGGTYTLMTYSSISGGTFTLDNPGNYPGVTLSVGATSVTLTVTGTTGGVSGVWTNLASGNWATAANWQGGVAAGGADALADFSTLAMAAAVGVTNTSTSLTVGHMVFADVGQTYNWTLAGGTNTLAVSSGSPRIVTYPGQNATISTALRGTQGLVKAGGGTLTLSGANKFTGPINVSAGTLVASSAGALNSTNDSSVVPVTLSNATLSLGGNKYTNNITIAAGTSNTISAGNVNAFMVGSASGPISGGGVVTVSVGGTNPKVNGGANHNFTGTMIVSASGAGGVLFAFDDGPSAPGFGYVGSSNAVYEINGGSGTKYYMATSDWVSNGRAGATNYLGELRGDAALAANNGRSGTTTLEIGALNTDSTFSGIIRDNNLGPSPYTPMIIRKVGTGHLTLSGTSTYTGATDVRSGTLTVSGAIGSTPVSIASGGTFEVVGSIGSPTVNVQSGGRLLVGSGSLGSTAITLNGLMDTTAGGSFFNLGSATLSGSGTVTGSVAVASYLNPGPIDGPGTLTITNGNFTAQGGVLEFDISSTNSPASGNDFLAVNGDLDFSAPGVIIAINRLEGLISGGTYVLARCSGTLSGSVGNLTLVGANTLDYLQLNGNQLELVVAPVTSLAWTGSASGNWWDIATSTNWLEGLTRSIYTNGCAVTFDNAGGTNPVVNIAATVTPAVVLVSGATNYTFTGAGDISSGASLIKNGGSTLTVLNTNTFIGTAFVRGGTLAVGNAGTNGHLSAKVRANSGTAVAFNTPLDQVVSNAISGPGSFSKLGAGALTVTANNAVTGPATIGAGTLVLGDGFSLNGSLGTGSITNNGLLAFNEIADFTSSNNITGAGGIINQSYTPVTLAGMISGTCKLTNTSGMLTLAASNSYSGGTVISGGGVVLQNFSGFGTSAVTMDDFGAGSILMVPTSGTSVIANSIKLPQASTPQFVATNVSLTTFGTVRLTGVISGGLAATDTPIVNGGGTPAGNPRLVLVLENVANTFTMNPEVYSGCLAFISDGALGNTNNSLTVRASTTLPGGGFTDAPDVIGLRFDANNIALKPSRTITLVGNENINVQTNNGTIAGPVTGFGLRKLGAGTLTMNGAGSLTNTTTVVAGTLLLNNNWTGTRVTVSTGATLGGIGTINAPVTNNGTLSPGLSIGTLNLGATNLDLGAGSSTLMEINASTAACDKLQNIASLNYGGTLIVTNLAGNLALGQTFQLFSANNFVGDFAVKNLPALGSGLAWQWTPTNGLLSVVVGVATNPTNITAAVSGGNLNLSWPSDHLGWRLEAQTNTLSVGLSPNWVTVPGSTSVTATNFPINPANPSVFFRLVYP